MIIYLHMTLLPLPTLRACYVLNICVLPNPHIEILMPKSDGVSSWGLLEVVKS